MNTPDAMLVRYKDADREFDALGKPKRTPIRNDRFGGERFPAVRRTPVALLAAVDAVVTPLEAAVAHAVARAETHTRPLSSPKGWDAVPAGTDAEYVRSVEAEASVPSIGDDYDVTRDGSTRRYRVRMLKRDDAGLKVESVQFQQLNRAGAPIRGKTFTADVVDVIGTTDYVRVAR
jgi:hypothetical protein